MKRFENIYEGIMFKANILPANGKRAKHYKFKFFKEASVIVKNVIKRDNGKIIFLLQKFPTAWSEPVLSNGAFSREELNIVFQNKTLVIGMAGELRFCQTTSEGVPRATTFKSLAISDFISNII